MPDYEPLDPDEQQVIDLACRIMDVLGCDDDATPPDKLLELLADFGNESYSDGHRDGDGEGSERGYEQAVADYEENRAYEEREAANVATMHPLIPELRRAGIEVSAVDERDMDAVVTMPEWQVIELAKGRT